MLTMGLTRILRIGYEYNWSAPNSMPCFSKNYVVDKRTLFPERCQNPGSEIEFLQHLVQSLNMTNSYSLNHFHSGSEIQYARRLRIGYEYGSSTPSSLPCFYNGIRPGLRTLFPKRCPNPGTDIDFLQLLVQSLNLSYDLNMFDSGSDIEYALHHNQVDINGHFDSMKKPRANLSYVPVYWEKHYCYAYLQPQHIQLPKNFSPFAPFDALTWFMMSVVLLGSILLASKLYLDGGTYNPWSKFEQICLVSQPCGSNYSSYVMLIELLIISVGVFKVMYSTRFAPHLISEPYPQEWSTISQLQSFIAKNQYQLYVREKYVGRRLQHKYFRHSSMRQLEALFVSRKLVGMKNEKIGLNYLASGGVDNSIDLNRFMMPLSVKKSRLYRTRQPRINVVCLTDSEHQLEALLIRKESIFAESLGRKTIRFFSTGLHRRLLGKYLGPVNSKGATVTETEMMHVGLVHFKLVAILILSLHLIAVVVLVFEVMHGRFVF